MCLNDLDQKCFVLLFYDFPFTRLKSYPYAEFLTSLVVYLIKSILMSYFRPNVPEWHISIANFGQKKLYFEIFCSGSIQETHLVMYVNYIRTTCEWYKDFSNLYRHLDDILDYCIKLFVNIFCHADYEIVWTFLTPKFCSLHISN